MSPRSHVYVLFGLLACLAGCSAIPISDVPSAGTRSAEIFVVRENVFVGSLNSQYLSIDGVTIARLDAGEYTKFHVAEGTHALQIRWTIPLHGEYVRTARFEATAGGQYLFVTWAQRGTNKSPIGADLDYSETTGIQQWEWKDFDRKMAGKTYVAPGR